MSHSATAFSVRFWSGSRLQGEFAHDSRLSTVRVPVSGRQPPVASASAPKQRTPDGHLAKGTVMSVAIA